MKPTDLFFINYYATQSELSTRMLEALGEKARKFDHAIITSDALNDLSEKFRQAQEELAKAMPRAKKVQRIEISIPQGTFNGWLTADGVTLLSLSRASAFITSRKEYDSDKPKVVS